VLELLPASDTRVPSPTIQREFIRISDKVWQMKVTRLD